MSATETSTAPSTACAGDRQPASLRHGVARIADQVAQRDPELVAVAQGARQARRAVDRDLDAVARRVDLEHLAHHRLDGDRPQVRHRHLGEVRQGRDDVVGQLDVPLDPPEVLGLLLGRGVAGVQQVVDRGLDHVERVAQLVGDAAGDLPERRQPLAPLEPRDVLGLVGVLDDRQVEVQQLVERADRLLQGLRVTRPALVERADQPDPQPRQRDVGVDLIQADLDVPPADPPAAGDVVGIVRPGQQVADPLDQRALEPIDLGLPARDDLARVGWRSISA